MTVKVLAVTSELYPLIKTGGLADVAGALPAALAPEGVEVRTVVPGYPAVMAALTDGETVMTIGDSFGGPARLVAGKAKGLDIIALDAQHLFARPGNPYLGPDGKDWPDNYRRFAALSRAAADVALGAIPGYRPDIVHAHDWQAGLTFAYMHFADGQRPGMVLTIHNLAFQGQFSPILFQELGLPNAAFSANGIEYYGAIGYLKAGLYYADRITTVSPGYAAEIRTPEEGMGMDGLLRSRSNVMSGILNGIDEDAWNPKTDPYLAANYTKKTAPAARAANKAALQARLGLDADPGALLFGIVTRLSWQKGIDLLLSNIPTIIEQGAQLAVLGSGDPGMEHGFSVAQGIHPGRIGSWIGYDEGLAHQVLAGSDAVLVPSRFEPCGLTQMYGLRYGTVPVVARVGGLADTVVDANPAALSRGVATGVQFAPVTYEMMKVALERTAALYRQPDVWRKIQTNGMAQDVSWADPARRYAALFRELAPNA
jgi:starch synthase